MSLFQPPTSGLVLPALLLSALAAGCSSSDETTVAMSRAGDLGSDVEGAGGTASTPPEDDSPGRVYALRVSVFTPDSESAYVYLSDSLDVTPTLDGALEIPGVGNFAGVDGRLLISSGDAPVITQYEISPDLTWQEGRSVSFAAYPLSDNANFFAQLIQDDTTAILPFDGSKRIIWDPTNMVISGTLEDSSLVMAREGLDLVPGGNRAGASFRDGDPMLAYFYTDPDLTDYGSSSHIAVWDAASLTEKAVLDIPCPGLSIATRAEDGSTYFSAFDMTAGSMQGRAVLPCIAKVGPNRALEATWDLREWTGGSFAANFRYIGGGKAVANVFRHEALGVSRIDDADPTVLFDALWGKGPFWELWLFDVESRSARPIAGLDPELEIDGWSNFSVVDGRTFVFLGYEGRTRAYELDPITGTARQHFDMPGGELAWIRLR